MSESSSSARQCPKCGASLPADAKTVLCPVCLMEEAMQPTHTGDQTAPIPPLTPEELAPHFPQLEIIECLGRGGMGVVYKARQRSLNRLVALKLLAPERARDAEFAARFTREAHALAALNHPHIVTVYDFGQAGGFYFLLMEFVDGVNLRQAMSARRFTPEQALTVVPRVCEALQYAHEHGIVHRDIKPENLLLDKDGRVKIADFGIARMLGDGPSASVTDSQPAGTPQYMAPEQKEHLRADHRADIYSLGVVLYEMLTGELPADKLEAPSSRLRGVQIDVRLDEIVLRALEKKPDLRYQTAGDFQTELETVTLVPAPERNSAPDKAKAGNQKSAEPVSSPSGGRWGRWDVWIISLCMAIFGGCWLERLQRAIHDSDRPFAPNETLNVMVTSAVATVILVVGAASLWVLARNVKAPRSFAASGKRILGRAIVPALAVVLLVRTFFCQPFVASTDGAAPEIPAGSHILVWKLSSSFARGDMIAYSHTGKTYVGRVVRGAGASLIVNRNGEPDNAIPRLRVVGKVISVYWRATGPTGAEVPDATAASRLSREGWQLWQAGSLAEAEAKFAEAVKFAAGDANAWNGLGWASLNSGKTAEAETAFRKVISLVPDHPAGLNGLGQIYLSRREYEKAEPLLLKAAQQGAQAAWFGLARLYLIQGKFVEALHWAQLVVATGQGDAIATKMLEAAATKHLDEDLRSKIEPPPPADAKSPSETEAPAMVAPKPAAAAGPAPAPADSISLAQAVNDFNKIQHGAAESAGKSDLTVEAVIAAIRWAMLDRSKLGVTNATFAALGQIVATRILPKGFDLELLSSYAPNDQTTFDVWSVRLRIPGTALPHGTTSIMIHEEQMNSHVIGEEERKVILAWQEKHRAQGAGVEGSEQVEEYRRRRAAAAVVDAKNKPAAVTELAAASDGSISLAQAVNDFNKRYHGEAEAPNQRNLTVEAVVAAIRWAMLDRPMLSVTNATFATLGRIIETQALPKGFELELLTDYEPNDETTFTVWSVRLRIPGTVIPGGPTCIMIHEQQISSHLIGEEERKVIRAWREKERAQGGVGSMERVEWREKYLRERAAAAAIDARNKPDLK